MEYTREERVAAIKENVVSKKSRYIYIQSMVKFIAYLYKENRSLLVPNFESMIEFSAEGEPIQDSIKAILENSLSN
jgi:hypothetical protein